MHVIRAPVSHRVTTSDLTRSLRHFGPLLPVFVDRRGEVIDGRRRLEICTAYKIKVDRVIVKEVNRWPLVWILNPERVTRDAFRTPQAAAHECFSDAGTIAAHWLGQAPLDGSRWNRMHAAFKAVIAEAEQGIIELTPERLVTIVRKHQ